MKFINESNMSGIRKLIIQHYQEYIYLYEEKLINQGIYFYLEVINWLESTLTEGIGGGLCSEHAAVVLPDATFEDDIDKSIGT